MDLHNTEVTISKDGLEKTNLTKAECNDLARFTSLLVRNYGSHSEQSI